MSKQIVHSDQCRKKIIEGINVVANAVGITLGPKGRCVAIEQSYGPPKITKDGVSVAKAIQLKDKSLNVGAQFVISVASKTADVAGDGTTTATVIADAAVRELNKAEVAGIDIQEVRKGAEKAVEAVIADVRKNSSPVKNEEEIAQVATVSSNGDREIGEKIANAMKQVGQEGVITVEDSKNFNFEVEVVKGMRFDRGYISQYFATNREKMITEFENPYILLLDQKVSTVQPLVPVLEAVAHTGKPLVLIADDVDGEALTALILNNLKGSIKVVAVKAPGFGDRKKEMLEDIAILTNGEVITEQLGIKLEKVNDTSKLGTANRVIVTKDHTTIVHDKNNSDIEKKVNSRCEQIREAIKDTTSDYEKEKLQERLAKLRNGVAVLKVGGATEVEQKERKDRVEDALHATRAAVEEGIVPGGGVALFYASRILDSLKFDNEDQRVGINIIKKVLEAPVRQIVKNAGGKEDVVVNELSKSNDKNRGFDARTMQYVDMIKAGIVDPTKVVRTALQDAFSVASLVIATSAMITDHEEDNNTGNRSGGGVGAGHHGGMGGMDF